MLDFEWDNTCDYGARPVVYCELCSQPFKHQWQLEIHRLTVAGSRWCR